MNMRFDKICVDSGLILISDKRFYDKYQPKFEKRLSTIRKIKPGKYALNWNIKSTWRGPVSGEGFLDISSGEMVVSDPCYLVPEHMDWSRLLEQTNYFNNTPLGTVVLDKMGGDGIYCVHVRVEKVGELDTIQYLRDRRPSDGQSCSGVV